MLRHRTARTVVATLALVVVAWSMVPVASAQATAPTTRALWVWQKPDPASLVSFAVERGVRDLYVHVTPTVLTDGDLPRLTSLARLAQQQGLRLIALGGDPTWTTRPAAAVAWQRTALGTGLFAAAHVDVEPQALPAWSKPARRVDLGRQYVEMLRRLQAANPLPLEADVPFWFDTVRSATTGRTLADDVLDVVDAVTVMSYRDTATGILSVGTDVLQRSARLLATTGRRVPVHLAAETNRLDDCTYCTFFEEGQVALSAALDEVDAQAAADWPTYAGVAVHDQLGWAALRR